jgi:hypothetical protein
MVQAVFGDFDAPHHSIPFLVAGADWVVAE